MLQFRYERKGWIMKRFLRKKENPEKMLTLQLRRQRLQLRRAGLKEAQLRKMEPDERVVALEQARLDPYDFIYLAC